MAQTTETEMSADEIDDVLGRNETGVLSVAVDGEPYSIPISYGYDVSIRTFYLRLVATPDSKKQAFLDAEPTVSIVVYDESDAERDAEETDQSSAGSGDRTTYRSVVASGPLVEVDPETLSVEEVEQYGETRRPLFEIWNQDRADLDIRLYEVVPAELSGRQTAVEW
jgi:nitroimidazol reductase NimA-like FMN-containing flavoprotein (pyridoxamine 5'-phosphate oxidase superfamily)